MSKGPTEPENKLKWLEMTWKWREWAAAHFTVVEEEGVNGGISGERNEDEGVARVRNFAEKVMASLNRHKRGR